MKKTFKGFSLIEMLLTLVIISIIFLITAKTLNTIIKVSTITKYKNITRNEAGFAMELTERLLANSNVNEVYIFDSSTARNYQGGAITSTLTPEELIALYSSSLLPGSKGNEIHVRPYGYNSWNCIGYFVDETDPELGYLLKRAVESFPVDGGHESCFDDSWGSEYPILVLNSEDVTVKDFQVSYTMSELVNNIFYVDLEMEPRFWSPGKTSIEKAVFRQSTITTQGLTWY